MDKMIVKNKIEKVKLIIFPGFFLPHIGGLETHVNEFSKYMSKNKNYEITIFVPNIPKAKEIEIIHNGVKVIRYPAFEIVSNFPVPKLWSLKFWELYLALYDQRYNIVMTRTMFFTNSTLGLFFAKFRIRRIKLIHVEHGSDFSKLDSVFKRFINKLYMKILGLLLIRLSNKVIGVSNASKEFLRKEKFISENKVDKIDVIKRGFHYDNCELIKANLKLKKKYKNKKIISFSGRLIDGKGVQDILKALKSVRVNYVFLIIGSGEYEVKLKLLVKIYNLNDNVVFLGRLPHDEVISILKASDVFVNPSHTEGLPTSVLDGVFSGCKVLATNVGGTYEILDKYWKDEDMYELINVKDISAMKRGIERLFGVKNRISSKVIDDIKVKFDWDKHVKKYDKIIAEVLKK